MSIVLFKEIFFLPALDSNEFPLPTPVSQKSMATILHKSGLSFLYRVFSSGLKERKWRE